MRNLLTVAMLAAPLMFGGCVENGGQVQILFAAAPDLGTCTFSAEAQFSRSTGIYDPTGQDTFSLGLVLRNNMAPAEQNGTTLDNDSILTPESNTASIIGFDYCFFESTDLPEAGEVSGNSIVNCDDLPAAQRRFVVSSGTADPDGGLAAITAEVLSLEDMRALWGDDCENDGTPSGTGDCFSPGLIPVIGTADDPDSFNPALSRPDPIDLDTRDPAWGTFPASYDAGVVVQLSGRVKTADGRTFETNTFHFPIEVRLGLVRAFCGIQPIVSCTDACDGAGCVGGICGDGSACTPSGRVGETPDLTGICRPFEGVSAPICTDFDECAL